MPFTCEAVIRYRHKPVKCEVKKQENKKARKQKKYSVKFEKPQRAITPGQSVVFYGNRLANTNGDHANGNNDEVLGGGVISF